MKCLKCGDEIPEGTTHYCGVVPRVIGRATVIMSSGLEESLGHRPTLKEAQEIVGGDIELYHIKGTKQTLVLNEEGKLQNLPVNKKASYFFSSPGARQVFVGNVIVLEGWSTVA